MPISSKYRRRLIVMVKEPRPGRVKTRLGRDIGMTAAAWWFRHQCRALIRRLRDQRWQLILAVSPDHAGLSSRVWPQELARWPQGPGDLGDRMARLFIDLPPGPVLIIGADIPGIRPHHIEAAFRALGAFDAVFGPAADGGYWLIGLNRRQPLRRKTFDGVRWSTRHALADTLQRLPSHRIAFVDTLQDVDTGADLGSAFSARR